LRAKIAIVLMIVPLLAAIAVRYWPKHTGRGLSEVSRVVMQDPRLVGGPERTDLAAAWISAVRAECDGKDNLSIATPSTAGGEGDAVLQSAITLDAGLIEIDVQLVHPKTGKILWRDAYQARQTQTAELMRSAAQSVLQALRG
jgi:hypothetical protein